MKNGASQIHTEENAPQIVGANIRELRRRAHLSQGELARRLGMRQSPVSNLEQGKNLPSAAVLLRLAAILNVTADRILRPDRYIDEHDDNTRDIPVMEKQPTDNVSEYTHKLSPTSPAAKLTAADPDKSTIESVIRDYLALEDICHVPRQARVPLQLAFDTALPGLARLATQFRALLGIGDAVVFDPLELCENHGLRVVFMPMTTTEKKCLSFHDAPNGNVFILINSGLNSERQLFSLAYELGRILLYTRAVFMGESPFKNETKTDKSARHFAACFLMPESAVRTSVGQTGLRPDEWDFDMLLRLKHRFGVSTETFNYRLLELGLITPERQAGLRTQIKDHYAAHAFAEPGNSRRILSPNGRLGDLLHTALHRADLEAKTIAARLNALKIHMP